MVLVTGAAGLVGNELISQLLAKGKKVRAVYNRKIPSITASGIELVQCSVLDVTGLEDAMNGINEVYHCAGLVSFAQGNEGRLYQVNVDGTANIVNAALDAGVRKLVHVSSVAALGSSKNMITEDLKWTGDAASSKYAKSKYLGEMEVWRGIAEGLNAVIVNPSIILGAGDWNEGSTGLFKSAYKEFKWFTEGVKGFVDVRDVATAMIMLMESEVSAERFILSAENEVFRNLFNKMALSFNKKPPAKKATPFLASVIWRMQVLKNMFGGKASITKETSVTAFAKSYYDNTKLLKYFPEFVYRPLDDTIRETCMALQQKVNNQ